MKSLKHYLGKAWGILGSPIDPFVRHNAHHPEFMSHDQYLSHLISRYNEPRSRILKLGSREHEADSISFHQSFPDATCIGFDLHEGPGVDVVGDVHRLSQIFDSNSFDLVYSSAVFEHLYAPWIVVEEISKILRIGGRVFTETHFSYTSHARPWHFFQFSDMGLRLLFNASLGYNVLDYGMSNPLVARFSSSSSKYLRNRLLDEMYCHSCIYAEKTKECLAFDWHDIVNDQLIQATVYPK
jgi:SAM-dependent methyltransferase